MTQSRSALNREERLKALIEDIIGPGPLYVVDVEVHSQNGRHALNVYLDSDEGITVDQCAHVHRELSTVLNQEYVFTEPYRLNVSSPGIKRPLKLPRQYRRHRGKNLKVTRTEAAEGTQAEVQGRLVEVLDDGLLLDTAEGQVSVRFSEIEQATVQLPW